MVTSMEKQSAISVMVTVGRYCGKWVLLAVFLLPTGSACKGSPQNKREMPRADVVDVPAICDGLCVSNVFQSNMVLQRDKPIRIWGWATPLATVRVSFGKFAGETETASDRTWEAELPAVPASIEPQTLVIESDSQTLQLENILVGDVWIVGGQSNMEFPLDRVENGELEIVSANFPNIRVLTIPYASGPDRVASFPRLDEWSDWFGRHYRKGDWDICAPEVVRELSAIGYVFARRIHMASQVPIGIIDVSRGGTTVETWTPQIRLREMEGRLVRHLMASWDERVDQWDAGADLQQRIEAFEAKVIRFEKENRALPENEVRPSDLRPGPSMDPNRPGNCFAGMIGPLEGLQVKGVIFHQGYNNCFDGSLGATMYRQIFPVMIEAWREAFNDSSLPFGILSLCTEGPPQTLENYSEMTANPGPYIREAQYQTFLDHWKAGDRSIGFVSTYDLRRRWYHPQLKLPAGERIARWALATQYGFEDRMQWLPPILVDLRVVEGAIELEFDRELDAVDDGSPILGFAVASEDRVFHPATATHQVVGKDQRNNEQFDRRVLVLSSPWIESPRHFRYAWGRNPLANVQLSRNTDVPLATQRSDSWMLETIPKGMFPEEPTVKLTRPQMQEQKKALQEADRLRTGRD